MSNEKEDRRVLAAIFISAVILAAVFLYAFAIPRYSGPYFPLWILDQNHLAMKRTINVAVNESYIFYLGAQNKMGKEEQCRLLVKLRNMKQPIPVTSNQTPSGLPTLLNYNFSLRNDEEWETRFNFTLFGGKIDNSIFIDQTSIDSFMVFSALNATWDKENSGFYFQFLYELWLLNQSSNSFSFSGVWVSSPLLNVTR